MLSFPTSHSSSEMGVSGPHFFGCGRCHLSGDWSILRAGSNGRGSHLNSTHSSPVAWISVPPILPITANPTVRFFVVQTSHNLLRRMSAGRAPAAPYHLCGPRPGTAASRARLGVEGVALDLTILLGRPVGFMVSYLRGSLDAVRNHPGIVRWTRVDGVTLHDGTPRYAPQRRGEELLVFHFHGDHTSGLGPSSNPFTRCNPLAFCKTTVRVAPGPACLARRAARSPQLTVRRGLDLRSIVFTGNGLKIQEETSHDISLGRCASMRRRTQHCGTPGPTRRPSPQNRSPAPGRSNPRLSRPSSAASWATGAA